jgi:hypothetical protein
MLRLYPEIEPYAKGMLEVGGDDLVYWEVCGNPSGKPAIVLHGGPVPGVIHGIEGYSIPLRTALCCLINVVVGGADLMRASLRRSCRGTTQRT